MESSSIESNGATYAFISRSGDLSNQLTVAVQSNDSSMSVDKSSVIIKANESSTYVKVNGVKTGSAALQASASGYNESSVGFSIESAPLFSCVADISNSESPNPCGCLNENDGSGLTWYADGSQTGTWQDWCSGSGAESDPICSGLNSGKNGESLNAFNKNGHCGYSDWHLPTMITPGAGDDYVESSGGNWGDIGTYAINNGYSSKGDLSVWLDDNNFNINEFGGLYWSSASYGISSAWGVDMLNGYVNYNSDVHTYFVLVVRGRP